MEAAWSSGWGAGLKIRRFHAGLSSVLTASWSCFSVAALVNSQLVCLLPVGTFNHVIFNLNYWFVKFNAQRHQHLCYKHCRG